MAYFPLMDSIMFLDGERIDFWRERHISLVIMMTTLCEVFWREAEKRWTGLKFRDRQVNKDNSMERVSCSVLPEMSDVVVGLNWFVEDDENNMKTAAQ